MNLAWMWLLAATPASLPTPPAALTFDKVAWALEKCTPTYRARYEGRDFGVDEATGIAAELMGSWLFYDRDQPKAPLQSRPSPCRPDLTSAALLLQQLAGRELRPDVDRSVIVFLNLIQDSARQSGRDEPKAAWTALDPAFRRDVERYAPFFVPIKGSFADQSRFEHLASDPAALSFLTAAARDNRLTVPAEILAMLSLSRTSGLRNLALADDLLNQSRLKSQGVSGLIGRLRARLLSQPEKLQGAHAMAARAWNDAARDWTPFTDADLAILADLESRFSRDASPEGAQARLLLACAIAAVHHDQPDAADRVRQAKNMASAVNGENSFSQFSLTGSDLQAMGKRVLFSNDDYPPRALRVDAQGAVTVGVLIDPAGTPLLTAIETSSGNFDLDDTTRRIWLRRLGKLTPQPQWQGKYVWLTLPKINWSIPS